MTIKATPAERAVLEKLCLGLQDKRIAVELGISTMAVVERMRGLRIRNGARNRVHMAVMALEEKFAQELLDSRRNTHEGSHDHAADQR